MDVVLWTTKEGLNQQLALSLGALLGTTRAPCVAPLGVFQVLEDANACRAELALGSWLHTSSSPWCGSTGSRAKPDMGCGGRTFSQGGWCRSQLHRARPTYSGRKIYWAKDELWSGPVFSLRSGCRAGKVSSCPGPIPICYGPPSTASPSSAMFLKRLSHCLRPRGREEEKSR